MNLNNIKLIKKLVIDESKLKLYSYLNTFKYIYLNIYIKENYLRHKKNIFYICHSEKRNIVTT